MTTYTIAFTKPASDGSSLLLATVPDGGDIEAAAAAEIADARLEHVEYVTKRGLTLTDAEPEDENRIVWQGYDRGWLVDETGATFYYAVRQGS
jgi:hypothetical protein